jgi:transcriptional regulator GlxA family with amidase domain
LLRELIVRAVEIPLLYDERGTEARLMSLLLDEIAAAAPQPLGLPMPGDPRLQRLCELVLENLSQPAILSRLGAAVGLSERSVIRLFPKETGMSFRRWHEQARLLKAYELFDERRSVTAVALEVGYSTPAAFTKMFRRALGKPPTEFYPK